MGKLASLSSGLLARKGQARPAMRPQGFPGYTQPLEDLGWNDMGAGMPPPPASPAAPVPPVLVERAALATTVAGVPVPPPAAAAPAVEPAPEAVVEPAAEPEVAVRPVSAATAARIGRDTLREHEAGGKAAFTLRVDADRHLRLRLASAVTGRSSQALMIDALDALVAGMPEVETLVAQLPPPAPRKGRGR